MAALENMPISNLDIVDFPGDDAALGAILKNVTGISGRLLVRNCPQLVDLGGLGSLIGAGVKLYGAFGSDRRLKNNIIRCCGRSMTK
jgi:hypothetical protein